MMRSIFNTFAIEKENTDSIEFSQLSEDIINDLLTTNRDEIFNVYNAPNAVNVMKGLIINLINKKSGILYSRDALVQKALDYFFGYHIIQPLFDDPEVTDIRVSKDVWYKKRGVSHLAKDIVFPSKKSLETFVFSSVVKNGGTITWNNPVFLGGDIAKRVRILAMIPPACTEYPSIHFRIHRLLNTRLVDLKNDFEMMDNEIYEFLLRAVRNKSRIAIVGSSGSGKTTLMRSLINDTPGEIPTVTIEETPELFVDKPNDFSVRLVSRNGESDSTVTLSDYSRLSLLQGNEGINIGEIKGPEAFDICDAYSTGHSGINTFHVDDLAECHIRFAFMASKNEKAAQYSVEMLSEIFARAFDFVIYMENFKICQISEIDFDTKIIYRPLFKYEEESGFLEVNEVSPKFTRKFKN